MGHCYGPQQQRGLFRTRDGGKTWERVLFVDENTGAIDVAIDPRNPRNVFAATWQLVIHPWYSENGGPGSGIHVSRDGGTTWTRLLGKGLPTGPMGKIALGIAPSNPKRIYALIETADEGNLWRSDDGGSTWTVASRDPNINRRARYFSRLGVHPRNPDEVYFLAQNVYLSLDGGATTKRVVELFPDSHDIWFDPLDINRVIIANDRYVNISSTRGRAWLRAPLPNAQTNRVAVDRRIPYNVYASRQDGPAWRGPSRALLSGEGAAGVRSRGVIPLDFWIWTIGAENSWTMPSLRDDNIVWANAQQVDMRTRKTLGTSPWPSGQRGAPPRDRPFRLNWTIPLAMSPHDPLRVYVGSQYVHQTADGGETWAVISPDLTTNDKGKQGVPPGLWPETQDVPSTLIYIEESRIERGVIWTGSNDGVVSVTRDAGKTWTNVTANIPNLPPWGAVYSIAPSRHAFGAAYVTVDRHRAADNTTYVFKTTDYGRTWKSIGTAIPKSVFAYARVVREDPRRGGMLYLGTENALYVSVDDGGTWLPLQGNLPHSPIPWLVVQEDFDDLVVSTWGRGIWILDDIGPLREINSDVLSAAAYLFEPRPAYLFRLQDPLTVESFAADTDPPSHAGEDPPFGAPLSYFVRDATEAVQLTILNDKGTAIRTLVGTGRQGLNRVWWDLRPQAEPEKSSEGAAAARVREIPLVAPGTYTVELSVAGGKTVRKLVVRADPRDK